VQSAYEMLINKLFELFVISLKQIALPAEFTCFEMQDGFLIFTQKLGPTSTLCDH
jgi:hypothetical protein